MSLAVYSWLGREAGAGRLTQLADALPGAGSDSNRGL